ncbi:hypothetical protein ACJJH9_11690 [Microbulbifer sp. DLAB2-AF]|uniref:hypothetical protein n=1 Tax=Microbulbifer sp. DLAB2-AF TaxID=3243395 RepID=UPI004039A1F4
MHKKIILILGALYLVGCTGPAIMLSDEGKVVKVGKADPADNYSEIGTITATDGKGCGGFGFKGTYERAIIALKNKASELGGDYVQIYTAIEPHFTPSCYVNTYKINGMLFKKTSENPTPVPIVEANVASSAEKLRELKALLDEGIITKKEFGEQKRKILSRGI